jgi:hypothetical protein
VVLKPTVGVFDLVSKTSQGLQTGTVNLFGLADHLGAERQVRPRRIFDERGALIPYNFPVSYGSQLLRHVLMGYYAGEVVKSYIGLESLVKSTFSMPHARESDDDAENEDDESLSTFSHESGKSSGTLNSDRTGSSVGTPSVTPKALPRSFKDKLNSIFRSKSKKSVLDSTSNTLLEKSSPSKEASIEDDTGEPKMQEDLKALSLRGIIVTKNFIFHVEVLPPAAHEPPCLIWEVSPKHVRYITYSESKSRIELHLSVPIGFTPGNPRVYKG